jgi:hypothetical protein
MNGYGVGCDPFGAMRRFGSLWWLKLNPKNPKFPPNLFATRPRHASSMLKVASNSVRFRRYSSATPEYYLVGLPLRRIFELLIRARNVRSFAR